MGNPIPPPAWYPDPSGSGQLRWWDGRKWTQYLQPDPRQQAPAQPAIPQPAQQQSAQQIAQQQAAQQQAAQAPAAQAPAAQPAQQQSAAQQQPAGQQPGQQPPAQQQSAQQYRQSSYGQDQYGQERYGHDQYGQDQYGQEQHGREQYGQDQYGQGQYGQYGGEQHPREQGEQYGREPYGQAQQEPAQYGQAQQGYPRQSQSQLSQSQQGQAQAGQSPQGQQGQSPAGQASQSQAQQGQAPYGQTYGQAQYGQGQYAGQGYAPQRRESALDAVDPSFDGASMSQERVRQQVSRKGGPATGLGGGTLFTEPILVVNQRAKVFEGSTEYAIFDQNGQPLGSVAQIGQSTAGKALKMFSNYDALMPVRLEVRDRTGQPQIVVHKPVQLWKAKIQVTAANGAPIGEIGQDNVLGKIRFNYLVGGEKIGGMRAENLRGWDFSLSDAGGQEIARINKVFAGVAKTMFTDADNYVVRIHAPLSGPLAPLVLGSALTVDTVLRQR